jgi:hypothetical protein
MTMTGQPPTSQKPIQGPHNTSEYEDNFDEPIQNTLDLDTWRTGENLYEAYERLEKEVAEAISREDDYRQTIRDTVFSRLKYTQNAPKNAGVYQARRQDIERIHAGLLFNGGVEACDGISIVHDTLPLTITQIGVCLVSYNGEQGSWGHRLFRRDLRSKLGNPVEEVLEVLEKREKREAQGTGAEELSELARRGVMAYAERAILKDKSTASWRLGHGNIAPYELLTGFWANRIEMLEKSMRLFDWYADYKRFVFVPSAVSKRHLLTIGNALNPLEFAIVESLKPDIDTLVSKGHYRVTRKLMEHLRDDIAPKIVIGLYRVWDASPVQVFYAHEDYAEMAAHIAMADSLLQEHRGFPMLIDLADTVCQTTFGMNSFVPSVHNAYVEAGQPYRYLGERETRTQ